MENCPIYCKFSLTLDCLRIDRSTENAEKNLLGQYVSRQWTDGLVLLMSSLGFVSRKGEQQQLRFGLYRNYNYNKVTVRLI